MPSLSAQHNTARGSSSGDSYNVASSLVEWAAQSPRRRAIVVPSKREGRHQDKVLDFAELEALSNRYANALDQAGFARGMRVLLMVPAGVDFFGIVFALYKLGAVLVMIDPGMGVRRLLECVRGVDLQGFIGIPKAQCLRWMQPAVFRSVQHVVSVGGGGLFGPTLDGLARGAEETPVLADTKASEPAAILFTSGSTGPAKGVVYEHAMFRAQIKLIQRCYEIEPGEIDLPGFGLFGLFSIAMGMTVVVPDMDPSRPARVDPAKFVRSIRQYHVTSTFGSPAIWKRVATYCIERGIRLPSLKRVLVAGAPVSYQLIEALHKVLSPEADVHTPYGATESLPVSSIGGREVVRETAQLSRQGKGNCVGRPIPSLMTRVIRITDQPIDKWSDDLLVDDGEVGEIVVSGPPVTKEYFGKPQANRMSKIRDGDRLWHRIGDVGYFDECGRLWFCGRKAHRVEIEGELLFSVCCEAVFNEHPLVERTALVGVCAGKHRRPVLIVELLSHRSPRGSRARQLESELLALGQANERTKTVQTFLFHKGLPVDVRHNAKINREILAEWATRRLRCAPS